MFITAQDLEVSASKDGEILDIRSQAEYDNLRLQMSHRFLPMDQIDLYDLVADYEDKPVYILCQSGGRATKLAEIMMSQGVQDVQVIEGGISACKNIMPTDGPDTMDAHTIHAHSGQSFQAFFEKNS